ncbi:hypothetical protein MMC19_000715 [Ptychographa xylographoides]|nr:hypothetical protein [Ptychographa xylographoides]
MGSFPEFDLGKSFCPSSVQPTIRDQLAKKVPCNYSLPVDNIAPGISSATKSKRAALIIQTADAHGHCDITHIAGGSPMNSLISKFVSLPGEIKNEIYALIFEPVEIEIIWALPRKTLTYRVVPKAFTSLEGIPTWYGAMDIELLRYRLDNYKLGRKITADRRRLDYARRSRQDSECQLGHIRTPAALLFSCRQIHDEAISMFYGSYSFRFANHGLFDRFLSLVGLQAASSIRNLWLQHSTYGDPYRTENIRWKTLHDLRWEECCDTIITQLNGLETFRVQLNINDQPLRLNMEAQWAAPLLRFKALGLKELHIDLTVKGVSSNKDSRLRSCARVLERTVLGVNYKDRVDLPKSGPKVVNIAIPKLIRPKAIKCLVIRW